MLEAKVIKNISQSSDVCDFLKQLSKEDASYKTNLLFTIHKGEGREGRLVFIFYIFHIYFTIECFSPIMHITKFCSTDLNSEKEKVITNVNRITVPEIKLVKVK